VPEALPGEATPGVVHPVEHRPDAGGVIGVDELDLGHVVARSSAIASWWRRPCSTSHGSKVSVTATIACYGNGE
jgi:hypothetical protein